MGLNKISDEFQISESYFSHMFKEKTGVNFSTYLETIRLNEASRLIRETDISLNELYLSVGYNNANSFRRAFKKIYGITPQRYARLQNKQALVCLIRYSSIDNRIFTTPFRHCPVKGEFVDLEQKFPIVCVAFASKITRSAAAFSDRFPAGSPYSFAGPCDILSMSSLIDSFPLSTRFVIPRGSAVSRPIIPLGASIIVFSFSLLLCGA